MIRWIHSVGGKQFGTLTCTSTSLFPLSSSSPGTIFMITGRESFFIGTWLEGFCDGKISFLCVLASSCTTLSKHNHSPVRTLFRSGIFALYLQCPSNNFRESSAAIISPLDCPRINHCTFHLFTMTECRSLKYGIKWYSSDFSKIYILGNYIL